MLDSVQVLLQVTVPAAITAGALIWQNAQNSRREEQRRADDRAERQKDREHQTAEAAAHREAQQALAADDKRAAVEERWRDQRLDAHTHLLDLISTRIDQCQSNLSKLDRGSDDVEEWGDEEPQEAISAANARVQLLASNSAASHAETARKACQLLDIQVWAAVVLTDDSATRAERAESNHLRLANRALEAAYPALSRYREAARVDLGTDYPS